MSRFTGEGFEATVYVTRHGRPIGTGFLLGIPDDSDADDLRNSAIYVVTARHVVVNREGLGVRLNGVSGLIDVEAPDWWDSDDERADVSVAYLPPSSRYSRRAFGIRAVGARVTSRNHLSWVERRLLRWQSDIGDQLGCGFPISPRRQLRARAPRGRLSIRVVADRAPPPDVNAGRILSR